MSIKNNTPTLVLFGQDFEKHGGMRALALADAFHDEDPVDCLNYMIDACNETLGTDLAEQGMANEDALSAVHGACYDLRMEYGHGVWVREALTDYLHCVKGVKDRQQAQKTADKMIAKANARYAPIQADYERRRILRSVHMGMQMVEMVMDLLQSQMKGLRRSVEALPSMEAEEEAATV